MKSLQGQVSAAFWAQESAAFPTSVPHPGGGERQKFRSPDKTDRDVVESRNRAMENRPRLISFMYGANPTVPNTLGMNTWRVAFSAGDRPQRRAKPAQ